MDWIRDYTVFYKGEEYKNCVNIDARIKTVSVKCES